MPFAVHATEDAEEELAQLYVDWPELHQEITDACHEIDRRLRFPNQLPPFNRMARRPRRRWMSASPVRVYFDVDESAQEVTILSYEMEFRIFRP